MKVMKLVVIVAVVYVGIVATFESLLGYFQPESQATLVIATTAGDGIWNERVVSRLDHDGKMYVAANHWPRAWYTQVLENPEVQVTLENGKSPYMAVPVGEAEPQRVDAEHRLGLGFRILTGFPPRYFVRLDPR